MGSEVIGYECTNNIGVDSWKIFYVDNSNIYLIAGDYIPYNYIPASSAGHKPSQGQTNYNAELSTIGPDYLGSESIKDERIKALNNDYFNVKKYYSVKENMKAVAYMLDINAWSGFAGEKAEYAIGGPTIELFFNSYNKKYGTNYVAKSTSSTGYLVGNGSATGYQLTLSVNNDNLYVLNSQERANEMWLASPISDFQYYIMSVSYN